MPRRKNAWSRRKRTWILVCVGCLLIFVPLIAARRAIFTTEKVLVKTWARQQSDRLKAPPASNGPEPTMGSKPVAAVPGQFTTQHFTDANGTTMTYFLYVPRNYDPSRRYPLMLILHGTGERVLPDKTLAQSQAHLLNQKYVQAFVASSVQNQWPSFVVVPQIASPTARWVNVPGPTGSYHLQAKPATSLQTAIDIVATVQRAYAGVDQNRLYIGGISMGAYGVWDAIERWPSLFAAAAPISGAGDPDHANALTQLPIWDFHGSADTSVPVDGSRQMYAAIQMAGGISCYTEFPGYNHDLWNTIDVYAQATFQKWLFSQTKASTSGTAVPTCAGKKIGGVPAK